VSDWEILQAETGPCPDRRKDSYSRTGSDHISSSNKSA